MDNMGSTTIEKLFEKNLDIPHYQRPYAWEKEQVEDLICNTLLARSATLAPIAREFLVKLIRIR